MVMRAARERHPVLVPRRGRTTRVRLFIAGAAGRTGRIVVRLALERGHEVTAFVHDPARAPAPHPRLTVAVGDARDPAVVAPLVPGHDAIVSVLSHPGASVVTVFSAGTRALADAAEAAGVRRFVAVSAEPVGIDPARLPLAFQAVLLLPRLHVVYEDMARMERDLLARDALDWTIVRPAVLTGLPARGRYRTEVGDLVDGGVTLSRADLAGFLMRVVEEDLHVRKRVAIAD
jgi:putative NADH-flavin reductase